MVVESMMGLAEHVARTRKLGNRAFWS